jgi:hypothetical protein
MCRSRLGLAALVVLASQSLGGSCGGSEEFHNTDVTGTWEVYRTYSGEPERGPDTAAISNAPGPGWGVQMHLPCSTYVLPAGKVDIAGELRDGTMTLTSPDASWVGHLAAAGDAISGTFSDTRGSGTWRAVKVATSRCTTYEVWGGTGDLGCSSFDGHNPELYGYTFLGSARDTHTFAGRYPWYYVVTRDLNQVRVDTVETFAGWFPGSQCTGNVDSYQAMAGAPDGAACTVGAGSAPGLGYRGGYLRIGPETATTTIEVYVLP